MSAHASCVPVSVNSGAQVGLSATTRPTKIDASSSTTPKAEASPTRPGRMKRMYTPISSAIGIVAAMVNRPHGLPVSAFTTTSASTARMMIMIASTPTSASAPGIGPSSILIISPSDLPSRRIDANRTMKSCTAPATTTPTRIHKRAGQVAHLRRQHRPDQRPRARDGREVVAVEHATCWSARSPGRRCAARPASAASRRAAAPSRR